MMRPGTPANGNPRGAESPPLAGGSRLRIGLVASEDARDRASWSGTMYYMAQALERHCGEVVHLGPVFAVRELVGRLTSGVSLALRGRRRPYHHTLALSREFARRFESRLSPDLDLLFAPAASTQIALLETGIPIIYTSDATIARNHDYHPGFSDLKPSYLAEANEIEKRALERAALVLYPSEWAAESARDFYGIDPSKIEVIPYGANLDLVPERERIRGAKSETTCRLLFLGVNWERKGGAVAYEAFQELRQMGIDARLTICGSVPPFPVDPEHVRVIPRLDKNDPAEQAQLSELLLESNFLVLPTLNDCYGVVFCEASAHGTPSLAPSTGGVGGAITDGENGFLLPVGAAPTAYARRIAEVFSAPVRYAALSESSRDAFDERLNWDAWGGRVRELISQTRRSTQAGRRPG